MPLTRSFDETVRESAQQDPVFRAMLLPSTIDLFLGGEVQVGKISLRQTIYAIISFKRLGALMGKSEASLREMLHPDYDTSANDIFEIIHHISKHEGLHLKVSAQLADDAEQVASDTAPPEMASVADG